MVTDALPFIVPPFIRSYDRLTRGGSLCLAGRSWQSRLLGVVVLDVRLKQRLLPERLVAASELTLELVVVPHNHQLFRGSLS